MNFYEKCFLRFTVHLPCHISVHPQTPANFSLVSSTDTTILVEWIPGYNDGQKQTFYLEHRVRGAKTWSLKEISHNTKQLTSLTYVLSGLQDSTLYELQMYSKNMFGRSLSTGRDIIQTRKVNLLARFSCLFRREMYIYCAYPAMSIKDNAEHSMI